MLQFIPKEWQDWLRVFAFPFQAYPVVATLFYSIFAVVWRPFRPRFGMDSFDDFAVRLVFGFAVCFVVLLCIGLVGLVMKRRQSAYLNFGMAVFSAAMACFCMPNYVRA
jgi:hypothetical protein